MADIKDYIKRIESAVRGEDVRDAIVAVLELINDGEANAFTLNGHPANYFAKQEDMDKILPIAQEAIAGNQRPISSGGVYDILVKILDAVAKILGEDVSGDMKTQLEYLNNIKKNIRRQLIAKQVDVDEDTKFSDYPNLIKQIPVTAEIDVSSLNVTKNGEYKADSGYAYNPVTVDVQPKTKTLSVTTTGTYKAKDDDVDGYSEVSVSIKGLEDVGDKETLVLATKKITNADLTNGKGEFIAKTDKAIGYSAVSVDVGGGLGEFSKVDIPAAAGSTFDYTVEKDAPTLMGWNTIHIELTRPTGKFPVKFFNYNGELLAERECEAYGTVVYDGPTPTKPGEYFIGWNPAPSMVVGPLDCYAQFSKTAPKPEDQIQDSWMTIAENLGAPYPIGSKKVLSVGRFVYDGKEYIGHDYLMMKVYAGEAGTTSTWIAVDSSDTMPALRYFNNAGNINIKDHQGWIDSDLRTFLNGNFIDQFSRVNDEVHDFSGAIASAAKQVRKYTLAWDRETGGLRTMPTSDKFWVPSAKEWANATQVEDSTLSYNSVLQANNVGEICYSRTAINFFYQPRISSITYDTAEGKSLSGYSYPSRGSGGSAFTYAYGATFETMADKKATEIPLRIGFCL